MDDPRVRSHRLLFMATLAAAVFGLFVLFGPPNLLAVSETPEFCASCHLHESTYEDWFHFGAHRNNKCVDCHLPGENVAVHYVWKSIDGMKDVALFYSGQVPENIMLTSHGQKVVQANCIRCHSTAVEMIDNDRQCWSCHRRMSHKYSPLIMTN